MTTSRVLVVAPLIMFGGLVLAPNVSAAPPVACEHRSAAHAAEHGTTVEADSRYHVARGELPTCDTSPDEGSSGEQSTSRKSFGDDDRDNDGKSRYCRKRWFC